MPKLAGFSSLASLPLEQVTDKISRRIAAGEQGMVVWWTMKAGMCWTRLCCSSTRGG